MVLSIFTFSWYFFFTMFSKHIVFRQLVSRLKQKLLSESVLIQSPPTQYISSFYSPVLFQAFKIKVQNSFLNPLRPIPHDL